MEAEAVVARAAGAVAAVAREAAEGEAAAKAAAFTTVQARPETLLAAVEETTLRGSDPSSLSIAQARAIAESMNQRKRPRLIAEPGPRDFYATDSLSLNALPKPLLSATSSPCLRVSVVSSSSCAASFTATPWLRPSAAIAPSPGSTHSPPRRTRPVRFPEWPQRHANGRIQPFPPHPPPPLPPSQRHHPSSSVVPRGSPCKTPARTAESFGHGPGLPISICPQSAHFPCRIIVLGP